MAKRHKAYLIISIVIFISIFIISVQYFKTFNSNRWKQPRFVKEWEIQKKKPGYGAEIISLTANQYGIFILVWNKISCSVSDGTKIFSIQHYDFDGNFINQWPKDNKIEISQELRKKIGFIPVDEYDNNQNYFRIVDSREKLISPSIIISDSVGALYIADYSGNKILKTDRYGNVLNLIEIQDKTKWHGSDDYLNKYQGITISKTKFYLISTAWDEKHQRNVPNISQFDLNGKLIKEKTINPPLISVKLPQLGIKSTTIDGTIRGAVLNDEDNLYLLTEKYIIMLDRNWDEKKHIATVLNKGFEKPMPFYDPEAKRVIKYDEWMQKEFGIDFTAFNTDALPDVKEFHMMFYYPYCLSISSRNELIVTFIGGKPFGIIDAIIFDKEGIMIGYWKNKQKSYASWYKKLSDIKKNEILDEKLNIAFYGNSIFMGRRLHITFNDSHHNIIQKFSREER